MLAKLLMVELRFLDHCMLALTANSNYQLLFLFSQDIVNLFIIQYKSENVKNFMLIYRNIMEIDAFLLDINLRY